MSGTPPSGREDVTVLATGGDPTIFDRGMTHLFQRFTYARLGIHARLANDAFELRGLERRGDKELFLRGRLPLPIDVVNAQPGRTVSFRSMLDRLRAIDFGGITTEAAGGR